VGGEPDRASLVKMTVKVVLQQPANLVALHRSAVGKTEQSRQK